MVHTKKKFFLLIIGFIFYVSTSTALAKKSLFKTELNFENQGIQFSGELVIDPNNIAHGTKRPAIIVIHGSGKNDRMNWVDQTIHFLDHGFAIFRFDKRGGGKSKGDWTRASMEDLSTDVHAAFELVSSLSNIDKNKIGIWGGSQGVAVGAINASLNSKLAFAILSSGYIGPLWKQDEYKYVSLMKRHSFTAKDISHYLEVRSTMHKFIQINKGYSLLEKQFKSPKYTKILKFLTPGGTLPPKTHPGVSFWRKNINFDVRSYLANATVPTLILWGDKDDGVNAKSAQQEIQKINSTCISTHIFKSADHGLYFRKEKGPGWAKKDTRKLVSQYEDFVMKWVAKVFKGKILCK